MGPSSSRRWCSWPARGFAAIAAGLTPRDRRRGSGVPSIPALLAAWAPLASEPGLYRYRPPLRPPLAPRARRGRRLATWRLQLSQGDALRAFPLSRESERPPRPAGPAGRFCFVAEAAVSTRLLSLSESSIVGR